MLLRKKTQGAATVPSSKIRDSLNLDEEWVITEAGIAVMTFVDYPWLLKYSLRIFFLQRILRDMIPMDHVSPTETAVRLKTALYLNLKEVSHTHPSHIII